MYDILVFFCNELLVCAYLVQFLSFYLPVSFEALSWVFLCDLAMKVGSKKLESLGVPSGVNRVLL